MVLRKTLVYFLIFVSVASFFAYQILMRAYDTDASRYDIEQLKASVTR